MNNALPIFYSFRRCPYAMRARLALQVSGQSCALREVDLKNKPEHMLEISPKATVPVLMLPDGNVLEQSLDIMLWSLGRNDPECWLEPENGSKEEMLELIDAYDNGFKMHLDRFKYATRYVGADPAVEKKNALGWLGRLQDRLEATENLFGDRPALADYALMPFVRQFANADAAWPDNPGLDRLRCWLARHLESARFSRIMQKWPVWSPGKPEPQFP